MIVTMFKHVGAVFGRSHCISLERQAYRGKEVGFNAVKGQSFPEQS
jgi:hypothetical protein